MIKNVHGNTVDYLGSAIVAGRFGASGAMPPEPMLCEELGVSRTVIRESVKSLVAKGLIQTGPKVGTRVRPSSQWNWFDPDVIGWQAKAGLTPEFIRDLQDLRMIMEPAAIRLAAQRASEQDISEIEQAYAGMVDAVENGGDYVRFDLLFHQGMIRASHNRMLEKMDQALGALLRTSFEISTVKKNGPRDSLPMHRAVLDALIAHDADRAEDAIILLIEDAHKDMAQVLKARRRTPLVRARATPPQTSGARRLK
ncbi:MAG: FadR family transcriptional regulator [Rhodoferax sp.]|nr:FadR family transcriptional regulator [Rhodoferax sp.]